MKMNFLFTGVFWGVIFVILGLLIIIKVIFNIEIPVFRILIALLLIWLGIKILVGGPFFKIRKNNVIFNESSFNVSDKKDEYNIIFGKGTINLATSPIEDKNSKVNINTVFAQGIIKLSSQTPAIIKINSAFAGVKLPDGTVNSFGNYVYKTPSYDPNKPHIIVSVDVVFAALDIVEF